MPQVIVKKRKVKEATEGLERSRRLAKQVLSQLSYTPMAVICPILTTCRRLRSQFLRLRLKRTSSARITLQKMRILKSVAFPRVWYKRAEAIAESVPGEPPTNHLPVYRQASRRDRRNSQQHEFQISVPQICHRYFARATPHNRRLCRAHSCPARSNFGRPRIARERLSIPMSRATHVHLTRPH